MRRLPITFWSVAMSIVLSGVMVLLGSVAAVADDDTEVCHYRKGSDDWEYKVVGPKAATTHLRNHANDGEPGGAVPGQGDRILNSSNSNEVLHCR